jgi:pimeloyl-ACP methyl ester carboxylesterase
MKLSANAGRVEKIWRKVVPSTLDALGPSLAVAANAVGAGLQKAGVIGAPKPKTLPPNLLENMPTLEIERPLVLVPGWNTTTDRFNPLVESLTQEGSNGGQTYFLKGGKVYLDSNCSEAVPAIPSQAKVFVCFFENGSDAPTISAPQLAAAIGKIRQATDSTKVDVAAYSMGGLAARQHLQNCLSSGEEAGIGKLMTVGTPHQGAPMADLALQILDLDLQGRSVQWIMSRRPLTQSDRGALEALIPTDSTHYPTPLVNFNAKWPEQRQSLEDVLFVGTDQVGTRDTQLWKVPGDGQVTAESSKLPDTPHHILSDLPYPQHRYLFSNPQLRDLAQQFFGWKNAS